MCLIIKGPNLNYPWVITMPRRFFTTFSSSLCLSATRVLRQNIVTWLVCVYIVLSVKDERANLVTNWYTISNWKMTTSVACLVVFNSLTTCNEFLSFKNIIENCVYLFTFSIVSMYVNTFLGSFQLLAFIFPQN